MADRLPTSSSDRRRRDTEASVGEFWIDAEIGKGSFATVYRGYHKVRKACPLPGISFFVLDPRA